MLRLERIDISGTLDTDASDPLVFVPVPFLSGGVPALLLDPAFASAAELCHQIINLPDVTPSCNHLRIADHLLGEGRAWVGRDHSCCYCSRNEPRLQD